MYYSDIIIVGSGIVGCCLARELSRFSVSVAVLDRGCDVAEGASKANSGIVHAGYDAVPGTKKALYNVRGAAMFPDLCRALNVPYRKCGAMVIGFGEADTEILKTLLDRGIQNGVKNLRLISSEEILRKEPFLNPEITCALEVPDSAIVSPYELVFAVADDAALNGVSFFFDKEIVSVSRESDRLWLLATSKGEKYSCRIFVNCSGASGAALHNMISDVPLRMTHRRGQYYLLDRTEELPVNRTIFQCPSAMGKGVLVTPTVHGNLLLGPNAEDIGDPLDTSTTAKGLSFVLKQASKTLPSLSTRMNITNFSGVRAHPDTEDFVTGNVSGTDCAFEAVGIESPGLTSAPAIAEDLTNMIVHSFGFARKEKTVPFPALPKPFSEMSDAEREAAVRSDPAYGRIICRCETVTEAEIRQAIHRPVGARTVDGIKRRTRAGMGRCQGGFCCPRVASIIAEETGVPLLEVTKGGGGSFLLSGTVESFLKGEYSND